MGFRSHCPIFKLNKLNIQELKNSIMYQVDTKMKNMLGSIDYWKTFLRFLFLCDCNTCFSKLASGLLLHLKNLFDQHFNFLLHLSELVVEFNL